MKVKKIIEITAFLLLFVVGVRFHTQVAASILSAGQRCMTVIIPSLYLFSVLAAFCVSTGMLEVMAVPLDRLSRKLCRMDGILLVVLVFSQLAGYPVGAQLLHQLRLQHVLSEKQERTMLCLCFGCGPAFLLGTVCSCMQLSALLEILLLLSVSLPNLFLALCITRKEGLYGKETVRTAASGFSTSFISSVEKGAAAMLKICSMILIFAALLGIFEGCGLIRILSEFLAQLLRCSPALIHSGLSTMLEISNIMDFLQMGGSLPCAAAFLSFGGFCVHLQNAAITDGSLPWRKFLGIRCLSAVLSYWLCRGGLLVFYRGEVPVSLLQPSLYTPAAAPEGVLPVLCLVLMSVLVLQEHAGLRRMGKKSQKTQAIHKQIIDK